MNNNLTNINYNFDGEEFREKFFKYLDVTSEQTIITYYKGITNFINYIVENNITHPTRETIIAWKVQLKEKTSSNTVNTWLVGVKRFFKFLSLYNLYPNITEDIKGYKVTDMSKKNILTEQQIKDIYSKLCQDKSELGIRNKALFSLLITTGLRGVEVQGARIEDIKLINDEYCLFVKAKGHTEYDTYVKLSDNVLRDILDYIGDRKQGYIFLSCSNHNKDGAITTKTIRYTIKQIFRENGLNDDSLSLHGTRRTFSCIAYNHGADIYSIQQVLHHASIQTTQRYLKMADRYNNNTEKLVAGIL